MTAVSVKAPLTPKADHTPHLVTLKVFWKSTKQWTAADIADFQKSVPALAEKIKAEKYWNKDGDIKTSKFTCEDFAIRILCEYASSKSLPVKLKTGVRVYRNMELYNAAEHDKYSSTMYGFGDMVMLTYGAPDMQRIGGNTVAVEKPEDLLPGDILAQAYDRRNTVAHHIQIVAKVDTGVIHVIQGNSSGVIVRPFTTVMRWLGVNRADPQNSSYAGTSIATGYFIKSTSGWNYKNVTTGREIGDFMKTFQHYRWNFKGFNT